MRISVRISVQEINNRYLNEGEKKKGSKKVDRVRVCWPPVATVPGPVLSGGTLSCSGSTCRPPRRTDQHCDRGGAWGGKEQKILLRAGRTNFPHLRPGTFFSSHWLTYPARSWCIICIWFSSLLLSALSSWNQPRHQPAWLSASPLVAHYSSLVKHMTSVWQQVI